jgi:hypothetical protein
MSLLKTLRHGLQGARRRWDERLLLSSMRRADGPKGKFATYLCMAGLGNRLQAHLCAHIYAMGAGRKMLVKWAANHHCGAEFHDLFEPAFPTAGLFASRRIVRLAEHRNAALFAPEADPSDVVAFDSTYCPFDIESLEKAQVERLRQAIQSLRPLGEVQAQVDDTVRRFEGPTIGIHIRMGDYRQLGCLVPMERYIQALRRVEEKLDGKHHCFLVSDGTPDELAPFLKEFTCTWRRPRFARQSPDGVREALVDMLALAATHHVVGTPGSSFNKMAALFGNVPRTEV